MSQQLLIASFVVRLFRVTEPDPAGDQSPWRVFVRHVQTGEEVRFVKLEDALSYIEQAAEADVATAESHQ